MLLAAVALLPVLGHSQEAIEAWVQRYGDGQGTNRTDQLVGMGVDARGNVYVAGHSYGGFEPNDPRSWPEWVTIAYSSEGVSLWTNYYNAGEASGPAYAMAVDAGGNVFVTGSRAIIKYSSAGIPLWTNRAVEFSPEKIALDADGNAFVAGAYYSSVGSSDYGTAKVSSAGELLWTKTYDGPANGGDQVQGIAVDASGNVVVAGSVGGGDPRYGGSGGDYATIKYSSAGVPLWTNLYNGPGGLYGPGTGQDTARAVAMDRDGNVIVTGSSDGVGSYWDYATIKYSSEGVPLWTNRYNGTGNGTDEATAVVVDASGNVYVTGGSDRGGPDRDAATIKYLNNGLPVWTNRGPASIARSIAVDARGNVYVVGGMSDYVSLAYSAAGAPLWTNYYNGPGNRQDFGQFLAVDPGGSVYVAGTSAGADSGGDLANLDFATVKYVTPPLITRQPLSRTNAVGTTANLSVEAAGGTPLRYQWRMEGTNLVDGGGFSGVATTNLSIVNVQLEDACDYTVVVTNEWGNATSVAAHLTVTIPPSAGRLAPLPYSPLTGFSFIFRDATVGQHYRIQRSPSMADGSWTDWQSFTYTEPIGLTDVGATAERRFYRAVTP